MIYLLNIFIFSFYYFLFQRICRLTNLYDYPEKNKIHVVKIAPIGGLIICSTLLTNHYFFGFDSVFMNILYIASLIIIIGVIDDKYNIKVKKDAYPKSVIRRFFLS